MAEKPRSFGARKGVFVKKEPVAEEIQRSSRYLSYDTIGDQPEKEAPAYRRQAQTSSAPPHDDTDDKSSVESETQPVGRIEPTSRQSTKSTAEAPSDKATVSAETPPEPQESSEESSAPDVAPRSKRRWGARSRRVRGPVRSVVVEEPSRPDEQSQNDQAPAESSGAPSSEPTVEAISGQQKSQTKPTGDHRIEPSGRSRTSGGDSTLNINDGFADRQSTWSTSAPKKKQSAYSVHGGKTPILAMLPSIFLVFVFVYCFIAFTGVISFTNSRIAPNFDWVEWRNYERLFRNRNWNIAISNLGIFGGLYVVLCTLIGLGLAVLIDQKIRGEGVLRPIYLYPMALSFIVTGTAWKWMLDPGIGLEQVMQGWGWESFEFRWIKERENAIYTLVIAAVWQSSGFVMALFLAGLRGIDTEVMHAAQIDGARGYKLYRRVVIPQLLPAFLSAFVVLSHLAIKAYDLVIAMTSGGPGRATELPATFMYSFTFSRKQMGIGAAAAVVMMLAIMVVVIPYLIAQLREKSDAKR